MTDYYGYPHYYASPYVSSAHYRDEMEYDGYDNAWIIGRQNGLPHGPRKGAHHYSSRHGGHEAYHHHHENSWPRSQHQRNMYYQPYDVSEPPRPSYTWPSEVPVTIRMSICCEGCRWKLDEELRAIKGVYDVGINGWSNALVTVRGTAPAHKILEKARKISKNAEFWSDGMYDRYKRWY